jgi:plastocyanin
MGRRRLRALALAVAVVGAATACSGGSRPVDAYGERSATRITGGDVVVELSGLQFVPQGIRIKTGTKVTWVNRDVALHNVSQIESVFLSPTDLAEGGSFSFTFDKPGTYKYQCTLHHPNMNGVVIVES